MYYMYFSELILCVFMGVFFVTLLERKVLGYIQFRMGPNKIIMKGFFQSLSDAVKLLGKGLMELVKFDWLEYNMMPLGMVILMLMLWGFSSMNMYDLVNSMLVILCIFSLGVFPIMMGGWFSGSLYSMLGAIRSVAQMISYEVSFIMIIMVVLIGIKSFSLSDLGGLYFCGGGSMNFWLMIMLYCSLLIEVNRTPIDLIEGESELVSGFNTEFYGFKFAMIFIAEYGMIMYMSGLFSYLCVGLELYSFSWGVLTMLIVLMVIWLRGVLPRIRYDKLMLMCWVIMLSVTVGLYFFMVGFILII